MLEKLARAFGVEVPAMYISPQVQAAKAVTLESPPDAALVPVYDVAASAGHGAVVEYESIAYSLAVPPDYLRRLTKADPRHLSIISVKGDSMEPTLKDDDIVMLDASKTSLSFDGLFVLRYDEALHVKRIGRAPVQENVTILSDNRQLYPPIELTREEVTVIGKVVWYGRKV
jgi:phage repressor protein C with HTH and peptisase S24 domain